MKKTLMLYDPKKKLPSRSGDVLVFSFNSNGTLWHSALVSYSHKHKLFNTYDHDTKEGAKNHAITCDFWAYPPNFEKEMQSKNEMQE